MATSHKTELSIEEESIGAEAEDNTESWAKGGRKLSREVLLSQSTRDTILHWSRLEHPMISRRELTVNEPRNSHAVLTNKAFSYECEMGMHEHKSSTSGVVELEESTSPPVLRVSYASGNTVVLCTKETPASVGFDLPVHNQRSEGNIQIQIPTVSSEVPVIVASVTHTTLSVPMSSSSNNTKPTPEASSTDITLVAGMHRSVSAIQLAAEALQPVQEPTDEGYVNLTPEERSRFLKLYMWQVSRLIGTSIYRSFYSPTVVVNYF